MDQPSPLAAPLSRRARLRHTARKHAPQFGKYLLSGGSAAFLELSSYQVMLMLSIDYRLAAAISGIVGLASAFTLHKYFVFQKKEKMGEHGVRYAILQTFNYFAQLGLVTVFVEVFGTGPFVAKVLGIGATVMWNFFLYKFFVYV